MGRFVDLTGQKFGSLTVLRRGDDYVCPQGKKYARWWCYCSEFKRSLLVRGAALKSGNTTCGGGRGRFRDLTGQVFGSLTALRQDGFNKHRIAVWVCWCDLTNQEVRVTAGNLKSGHTTSGRSLGHGRGIGAGVYNQTRADRGDFDDQDGYVYLLKISTNLGDFWKAGISTNPLQRVRAISSQIQSDFKVSLVWQNYFPLKTCVDLERTLLGAMDGDTWMARGLAKFGGYTECRLCSEESLEVISRIIGEEVQSDDGFK